MNGKKAELDDHGELPDLQAATIEPGIVKLAAESISFFAIPAAGNKSCR